MNFMDDLLKAFYSDIEEQHSVSKSPFDGKDNRFMLTPREAFEMLPQDIRDHAYSECRTGLDREYYLGEIFNVGFHWLTSKHGDYWRKLHHHINCPQTNPYLDWEDYR
jgi:hypothetical protein